MKMSNIVLPLYPFRLVQPSKFELHHLMQKDVFQNHHHKVDKVEWETLVSGLERRSKHCEFFDVW